ncbi:hypothetical protein [Lonsdalea quercina]|uniref:hypothetical protein n=1 Tax=Lonsdalea quercina TaxID=71657 RepID=UPI0039752A70
MAELRSSTLTLRRGFVARRQGSAAEPRQWKITPTPDVDRYRKLPTGALRRQTFDKMRQALTDVVWQCRAFTASPSLPSRVVMLFPNYFNLMLTLNVLILQRIIHVNGLKAETAAAGQQRHSTISALLNILSPLQAEQL